MLTHYLGTEEVTAYCKDLSNRLVALGDKFPTNWFVLGVSGTRMAIRLVKELPPAFGSKVKFITVIYDRSTAKLDIKPSIDEAVVSGEPVLVVDSAVHSGKTMLALVQELQTANVKDIITYTLVLKRGAVMVPNFFGLIIDDKDRTIFELNPIPNNRLMEAGPFGVLREVKEGDELSEIGGAPSPFETLSTGDLLYGVESSGTRAYIFEYENEIAGFVTFRNDPGGILFIDAWATADKHTGKGVGTATFRWAETWARSTRCSEVRLWAFEGAISRYQKYGYEFAEDPAKWRTLGAGQRYKIMRKKILYNLYEVREFAGPYAQR